MRHNSVTIDTAHGLIHFPHMTMQAKKAAIEKSAQTPTCLYPGQHNSTADDNIMITAFVDHPSKWHTTGTLTPVEKITEAARLLKFQSLSTIFDKTTAIRITNTTESPHLTKKNTQFVEFSVVAPEQPKFIKLVDTAVLSMIPKGDPNLTTYLSGKLRTNKPQQQSHTFSFRTPENPGKTEDHTPIETPILKELRELQEKKELNPKDDVESQMKFLKRFDWTVTLLTETEKHAVENILVEHHDISARHRMDVGMDTEFKMRLTPKDDKAAYRQSLPTPIHLKEDLIVELTLMHKYGIIIVLPFSKKASPIIAQRKPNGKLRLLVDFSKINFLIADDYTNTNQPVRTL